MKYRETFLKYKKKNTHDLEEHYKNLSSLQRRLGHIGSVSNPSDKLRIFINFDEFCS